MVSSAGAAADYESDVLPILEKHCISCHGPDKEKGDIRFDTLSADLLSDSAAAETWHDALDALTFDEMPPEDEPRLSDDERRTLIGWINGEIEVVVKAMKSTGGRPVVRRLNRLEYQNTMAELLGIDTNYTSSLPPESLSEDGFKNNGATLQMSAMQMEFYLAEARKALNKAIVTGEQPEVFRHVIEQSNAQVGSAVSGKEYSNTLSRTHLFLGKILDDYHEQGDFLIRIRAKADLVKGQGYPQLELGMGYTVGSNSPIKQVAEVDVVSEQVQAYEFRGRIEDFPLPDRNQGKFPGLLLRLTNLYDDGSPGPETETVVIKPAEGKKKAKTAKVWLEETHLPRIQVESVEFVGPVFESWPPKHHTSILFPSKLQEKDERAYAGKVLHRFMQRAFRRPVEMDEVQPYLALFDRVRSTIGSFEVAIREPLAMVLISPDFLYLVEPSGEEKRPLNDWEIASRLSYFLWGSMPDNRLFTAAGEGRLTKKNYLRQIVASMLKDDRSWNFVDQFVDQWLDVGAVDRVAVNPEFYPEWDDALKPSIREETKHFFAEVLHHRMSALNFLDSDFAMVNRPLARHYGIEDSPRGTDFERVVLPEGSERGGVLTQASVLLGNSTGEDSHPVLRAVWLRERLLDDPPANPPPNVPGLDSDNPDFVRLPVREQLEIHREQAACNDCHRGIDPWGIAMDGFGADGLARTEIPRQDPEKKNRMFAQAVVTATVLPGGAEVDGMEDLKAYLLEERHEQFARALVTKLLTYALGRSLELTDEDALDELTAGFIKNDHQLHRLVQEVVASEAFLTK
tara:strand:- start:448 stop:2838 length:2391 start_codon:yes stop_codon:yes gene_type:complete